MFNSPETELKYFNLQMEATVLMYVCFVTTEKLVLNSSFPNLTLFLAKKNYICTLPM